MGKINKNRAWTWIGAAVLLYSLVITTVFFLSHDYVITRAESDIEAMLLQHKGVHHYVQRLSHPELYSIKANHGVPEELYSPVLFSSSYMVRNMHQFYNEERKKAGLPELYYKMAAIHPRNPVNQASELEAKLIKFFNENQTCTHYQEVVKIGGQKQLYVATPFLANDQHCLKCHGKFEDAPKQLQLLYPDKGGFNEELGYIRAIESLRAPLTDEWTIPYIALISAGVVGAIILGLFLLNRKLGMTVKNRTQQIQEQSLVLQTNEENLRITLDSIGEAVIATDIHGRIIRINPVAAKLIGWKQADALGQLLEAVLHLVEAATRTPRINPVEDILKSDPAFSLRDDTILIAKDGTERLIADSGAPIRDAAGEYVGTILILRDITEQRALEQQLQQSRKMDAIGQLAGGVAHDFNNLLCGIMGSTELLQDEIPQGSCGMKYVDLILTSATRAADLTSNLLAFSRKSNLRSDTVPVHAILKEMIGLLSHTLDKRILIQPNLNAPSDTVTGDASQLQNVFLNLCINAGDAMPDGGKLSISTRLTELDEAHCKNSLFNLQSGPHLIVEIHDTGTGIPLNIMNRIFEPFFTTKAIHKGTGLGLAAAFGTIKQHNGSITVYSEEGQGTLFNITLPLTNGTLPPERAKMTPIHGSGTILIAEDEEAIRVTTESMLTRLGYQVLTADNGEEAVQIYRDHQDTINLVLLDKVMPKMNGTDCLKQLLLINPHLAIVLSSGFTDETSLAELNRLGLKGFIQKPYQTVGLSQAIAAALQNQPI